LSSFICSPVQVFTGRSALIGSIEYLVVPTPEAAEAETTCAGDKYGYSSTLYLIEIFDDVLILVHIVILRSFLAFGLVVCKLFLRLLKLLL
jgi:hypothetical protein